MAKLIEPDGTITDIQPKDKEEGFNCEELYKHIGCTNIEVTRASAEGKIIISDGEALCRGDLVKGDMSPHALLNEKEFGIGIPGKNEKGQMILLPYLNKLVTTAMHPEMGPLTHNVICGTAIICNDEDFK
jgi:hypothetical protein